MGRGIDVDNMKRDNEEIEEMDIDGRSKEKSRDSGKHRNKDGKKERLDDTDRRRKDRERSSEEQINRDLSRYDARDRDRDRLESRERRKEERSDYGRDKEYDRDHDRSKERSRDQHQDDYDRDYHKEKERDKDKGKTHNREREHSTDREHDRGRDYGKDRGKEREKTRETDRDRDYMHDEDRGKERDRERSCRERGHDKDDQKDYERGKVKDRNHDKEKNKDREKEKDPDRSKDREREKERSTDRDKQKDKEKDKERDNEMDRSKERDHRQRTREKDKEIGGYKGIQKDERAKIEFEANKVAPDKGKSLEEANINKTQIEKSTEAPASSEIQERLRKMKEERMRREPNGASEVLSWVSKSRKLEEKKAAEKQALRLSQALEEQYKMEEDDEEDETGPNNPRVAGVKILHGLDKVIKGGSVVLTLKDQNILADGDVNEEADMLENVEIGEQKRRDEAYKAAKKKSGIYDDKFSNDAESRRTILPQYDDPVEDEGVELDESGLFTGEAEKKLQELRKRIEGVSAERSYEDLSTSGKVSSDFYTPEEMLQFKKPKKKKSLRKEEKLDLDALEAEAVSAGLGADDHGSRTDKKRQAVKEEQEKIEAQRRSDAYQEAYAKAEEASKALRESQTVTTAKSMDDEDLVFGDDYEDLQKSLEQARKIAIKKQEDLATSGLQAIALVVSAKKEEEDTKSLSTGETQADKVVITEMEEFVLGLQLNEEKQKPESEDVFMDEEDIPKSFEQESVADIDESTDMEETSVPEPPNNEEEEEPTPDEIIHEAPVGKGLAGALHLLKDRGSLNETIDWGGRNMDKKKSKLIGLNDNDGPKEIRIERTDEFGRILTPKEAFRILSHKFHGKGPGKMKQEKRMKQFHEDLKRKQMKASDTPLLAMERMREAQAQLKTPYLVLSGHVKPGQTSDPRSGFATVEKDHLGSLTPMLGDKKVEHFLGIKLKTETGSMPPLPPKKPKS